jgi:anthranilate synthase component 1
MKSINNSLYYPDYKTFKQLSKKGNLIPVFREILADFETPVSAFCKIDKSDYGFLLESIEGQEKIGRYTFLGSNPSIVIKTKGNNVELIKGRKKEKYSVKNPLDEIKRFFKQYKFVKTKGLPRFCGGLVGYLGYDMVRFIEDLPDTSKDTLKLPDSTLMLTDTILIFDHVNRTLKVISNAHIEAKNTKKAYDLALKKIESIIKDLNKPHPEFKKPKTSSKIKRTQQPFNSNFSQKDFQKAVKKAKEYIKGGDIIQAVLSQRFKTKIKTDPFNIYRTLRYINPSPYMYYLKFKDVKLIGSSPEIMVRLEDRKVEVRPIAGTRPRGKTPAEDERLTKDLLKDPKEIAEHIMLVDLGRNDIGRVCNFGSVAVPELMTIEKYSHVSHMVSDCIGKLKKNRDMFDVIKGTFPAGTVSGAPKVRSMEIIEELEKEKRGPYAGSVAYFSFSGNLDSCITIRTIVVKGKNAYIQAGAGIVADSNPKKEYIETLNKSKGMQKAIDLAENPQGLIKDDISHR